MPKTMNLFFNSVLNELSVLYLSLLAILKGFDWLLQGLKSNDGVFMLKGGTNQRHVAMEALCSDVCMMNLNLELQIETEVVKQPQRPL